ncbi:MAG: hypothetical protein Q7R35_19910 [Elusimicrobiota bacterium]|nr:hypothetical protein [Elusimicrobiota bacterium]
MNTHNRGALRGVLLLSVPFFCACAAPGPAGQQQEKPSGPGAAIVFEKRTFKLVKTPDPDLEAALEGILSGSYDTAVKNHVGDKPMEIGFTYSLAPKGAVYPFSEIEVSCIMQEKYARRSGPEICGDFFLDLGVRIKSAVGGK